MSYTPPKVWTPNDMGGKFGGINRPSAGARHEQTLPKGDKPYQLYSLNTPNGIKVNIILEELKALGLLDYDAFKINIMNGEQFGTGFVEINPNSKIPALVDYSTDTPISVFESGAILLYLAQKYDKFLPKNPTDHTQMLSWLMWQMGSAPFVGGGFGHFYAYAPTPIEYAINRYAMETKRQLDVLDKHLAEHDYMAGEYSIADMAIYPWYGALVLGNLYIGENDYAKYNASEFLSVYEYQNVIRWANTIKNRKAVEQGEKLELLPMA
ncbi:Uncharacterized GST-like protein yghU [Moraxella caprae]|uniref:Uncharacterized GST-like protein yghU n=1 Tax=Moraxella caprae TaxID=90240 RepID=A0A378R0V9_9GAMM|nr:glutathione-dependent disulfide-bond oxidoreductase [Moraxella caprae]STZ08956.1 Uncharacterized GST-like protein yghU [Moraxella caprae]